MDTRYTRGVISEWPAFGMWGRIEVWASGMLTNSMKHVLFHTDRAGPLVPNRDWDQIVVWDMCKAIFIIMTFSYYILKKYLYSQFICIVLFC